MYPGLFCWHSKSVFWKCDEVSSVTWKVEKLKQIKKNMFVNQPSESPLRSTVFDLPSVIYPKWQLKLNPTQWRINFQICNDTSFYFITNWIPAAQSNIRLLKVASKFWMLYFKPKFPPILLNMTFICDFNEPKENFRKCKYSRIRRDEETEI